MPILCSEDRFLITNNTSSLLLGLTPEKNLISLHWGGPVGLNDIPETESMQEFLHRGLQFRRIACLEYPGWQGALFTEPSLKMSSPDGTRNSAPVYRSHKIEKEEKSEKLTIFLHDPLQKIDIELYYRVYDDSPVMEKWSAILNTSGEMRTLESAMSGNFVLPQFPNHYRLTHLHGRWGHEGMIDRIPLHQTKQVLESRTGLSGPQAMPFFALDQGSADEEKGLVWFGTLHWNGSWKIAAEENAYGEVSVTGGINDFDFAWNMVPGEQFETPKFSFGYTENGFGSVSVILNTHYRKHIENPLFRGKEMPLIVNTYASLKSGELMTAENVMKLMEKAASIGCELFVMDAGWQQNIGDWVPHKTKFPDGLKPIADKAHKLGMKVGIWAEIESALYESNVCKEHPEWIMKFPGKEQCPEVMVKTDRVLLNFARRDVMEHMLAAIDKQITSSGIDLFKIDMNRPFTRPGWENPPESGAKSIYVRYAQNVQEFFRRLREKHPGIMLENCAQGNSRADWAMQQFFQRNNRSDNQDSLDALMLHEGFTYLHLSKFAGGGCHISKFYTAHINRRVIPVQFQALAGMLGSLAIGRNLYESTQDELDELRKYAEIYKQIRHVTHNGNYYRILSRFDGPYGVYEYVLEDASEAVVFFFGHGLEFSQRMPFCRLRGLDPDAEYSLEVLCSQTYDPALFGVAGFDQKDRVPAKQSGRGLMSLGIRVGLFGDFASRLVRIRKIGR